MTISLKRIGREITFIYITGIELAFTQDEIDAAKERNKELQSKYQTGAD